MFLIVVMIVEGVWLAGLTYLILTDAKKKKALKEPPTGST